GVGRARQSRGQTGPRGGLFGAGAASIPTWWRNLIGPPRRREQGARSLARGAGNATDGGVLRTVEHARPHFGAAKTPQDARTMATSRIVAGRLAHRGDGACAVLTRTSLTQRRWHAGPQTQKPALPRSRCKAASHLFRLA